MSHTDTLCHCGDKPVPRDECPVLREFRLLKQPGGREQLLAEYRKQFAERAKKSLGEYLEYARKAGVPTRALQALAGKPLHTEALQAARDFANRPACVFLTLMGPPGVGKTVAAAYVAVDACSKWDWDSQPSGGTPAEPLLWVEAARLMSLSAFDNADSEYFDKMRRAKLLVLDDAGDEATAFGRARTKELLLHRESKQRRTVLCSNLKPRESVGGATRYPFREMYGEAVVDRLRTGIFPDLSKCKSLRGASV